MSDAYGSFGNPYGVPPPFPHQPPWGPPPGPPPGSGPPGPPPGPPSGPPRWMPPPLPATLSRPWTVTAGAVTGFVLTGLSIAMLLLVAIGLTATHLESPSDPDYTSASDLTVALIVIVALLGVCVLGVVAGGLALARRQWARIVSVVLAFGTAALWLLVAVFLIVDDESIGELAGGIVLACAAAIPVMSGVLLLLRPAGQWYAGRRRSPL